jgi:hypothetical protein
MKLRVAVVLTAACGFVACTYNLRGNPQQDEQGEVASRQAVLGKYCFMCHKEKLKSGGLALGTLDRAHLEKNAEKWEKVIRKLRTGAMPPVGLPRPDKAVAAKLVTSVETELDRAALANPNPGRPSLARLNRSEYHNAIRDLLAVDIDVASMLPADVAGTDSITTQTLLRCHRR